jgi:multiple sugar transport system substrate-binding protein
MTLHNLASWVWGAGGHFLSPDGRQTLISDPASLKGFCQYFELGRFLAPGSRELDDTQSDAMFWSGKAAVTISGPWLLRDLSAAPEVLANAGITFPPGVPFVGGSNLVIWQNSTHPKEALALVKFLTSQHVQSTYLRNVGMFPARLDVLSAPPYSTDPVYGSLSRGFQEGRSFNLIPLWGFVEDRLSGTLSVIWTEVLESPDLDLSRSVIHNLELLARRLDLILAGK